jgi:preprotein translocase subunit SecG
MQIWMTLVLALQLLSALVMIGLVLVQHGKGADMGASFGSGSSGSLFGATGSANFLSRSTAACATVFFLATLGLALLSNAGGTRQPSAGGSVLDRPASSASAPLAPAIPGAVPGAIPSAQPAARTNAVEVPLPASAAALAASAASAAGGK